MVSAAGAAETAPRTPRITAAKPEIWVTKDQVAAQNYDLSASRYRQVEQEEAFCEQPAITLARLRQLEAVATSEVTGLEQMLAAASSAK
jgi:type I restriction enzyme M protein